MGRTAMDVYVTEPTRDHRHVIEPTHDHRRLAAAVEESQDLLRYAAQAGIAVPEDIVGALVHAKSCLDSRLVPERAAVPVRIEILPALPLTAVGKIAKPALRLRAIDHVLNQALAEQGLTEVHATARLCAEQGIVVDLQGPAILRERALALTGLYPVSPEWKGASE